MLVWLSGHGVQMPPVNLDDEVPARKIERRV